MADVFYNSSASGSNDGTSEANAFTDLQTAYNSLSFGDHLHCKRAASREGVKSTILTFNKAASVGNTVIIIEGYENTPGDGGMYQTASPITVSGDYHVLKYFDVDKDDVSDAAFYSTGGGNDFYRCIGRSTYSFGRVFRMNIGNVIECAGYGKVSQAQNPIFENSNRGTVLHCYAEIESTGAAAGCGIYCSAAFRPFSVVGCVVKNSSGTSGLAGIRVDGSPSRGGLVSNNTVHGCDIGIEYVDGGTPTRNVPNIVAYGNLIYNVTTGLQNSQETNAGNGGMVGYCNSFGSITSSQASNIVNLDPITLTEDPFIDTTDFKLNNAPGGGALLKGKLGIPNPQDPSKLTSLIRTDFETHGGVQPNPVGEVSRSF